MSDQPLSRLQLDILDLEDRAFRRAGAKAEEFKRRHPHVTLTAYTVALKRLLADRRAWEYDGGRYASTLARIQRLHTERENERATLRTVAPE